MNVLDIVIPVISLFILVIVFIWIFTHVSDDKLGLKDLGIILIGAIVYIFIFCVNGVYFGFTYPTEITPLPIDIVVEFADGGSYTIEDPMNIELFGDGVNITDSKSKETYIYYEDANITVVKDVEVTE